ncbi:hypothetical protein [Thiohalophilus sp.]|uniref:hypothetical protein n=1 Tax=Thiohalophilus sp. TaxID=3028392 RepID=UPI002ACE6B31|nr:hypothetical protein [Thiohalophilus sp.]MDZ7804593.1 hypothetical protein [Thiohalophilus sp.]
MNFKINRLVLAVVGRRAGSRAGHAAMLFLVLVLQPVWLPAEEQISREEYVAQSHEDLLGPCKSPAFVKCLGTTEAQCLRQVNQLVRDCSRKLPAIITTKNFDTVADDYASCVFGGLQETFGMSSEEIGQCENRAGLR